MTSRLKVLCLPGWRTSATIMKAQLDLSLFTQKLGKYIEFVPLNPTFTAQGPPQPAIEKIDTSGKYYQWWYIEKPQNDTYIGLQQTYDYLYDYIIEHGPFDGLLGFSQGGALVTLAASLNLKGSKFTNLFKFVFLVATFPPGDKQFKLLMNDMESINIPSIHYIGQKDDLYEVSKACAMLYSDPVIIEHEKGHSFPKLEDDIYSTTMDFIKPYIGINHSSRL